jgi:hypothetical protein
MAELVGSDEFLEFLDFLTEQGAGDLREWVLQDGARMLFSGGNANAAREWLKTVEDGRLKERLCQRAGEAFEGADFEDYLDALNPAGGNCQAALLTGYCKSMAMSAPEEAQRVFKELCVPRRISYSGLPEVMSVVPPTSNFVRLASFVGADDKRLAKATRSSVLRSWAGAHPAEAAQYVLDNASQVHPDQMAVVVARWAGTAPAVAAEWLRTAAAGEPRDEGMAALARHWMGEEPAEAWRFVEEVEDLDKCAEVASAVFDEWVEKDRDAAEAAWIELFPDRQLP